MPGLSRELYQQCRNTLLQCSEFDTDSSLRAVFITAELAPLRDRLPTVANKSERVDAILAYLAEKRLGDGNVALPYFLVMLQEHYSEGDALRDELEALARQVSAALAPTALTATTARGDGLLLAREPGEIRARYALLIGVRDYVNPAYKSLPHTVHDVVALDELLRAAGYTVRTLHSDQTDQSLKPTRNNIWESLENIAGQTGPGDLLLVYFGGHGDLGGNAAYLLPSDGGKSSQSRTAIDLDDFKAALSNAGAQAKILFLDACHSGIGRDAAGMDAEFARHVYLEATGAAVLASCRQGEVSYEHDASPHGAFTHFVLEGLRGAARRGDGGLISFNMLNDYVTHAVKQWAIRKGLQQWPNASVQLVGDPPLLELSKVE